MQRPHRRLHGLRLSRKISAAACLVLVSTGRIAIGADGFVSCRAGSPYFSRLLELIREEAGEPIEPLVVMIPTFTQREEIGIGLQRVGAMNYLVRISISPSLSDASRVQIAPNAYTNNYAAAKVQASTIRTAVSNDLAAAFSKVLLSLTTGVTPRDPLAPQVMDAVVHRLVVNDLCIENDPIQRGGYGSAFMELNNFLRDRIPYEVPEQRQREFEAAVLGRLNSLAPDSVDQTEAR